jgi:hypothetical protein
VPQIFLLKLCHSAEPNAEQSGTRAYLRPATPKRRHPKRIAAESKDLQLVFGIANRRYFRIAHNRKMIADLVGLSHPVNAALAVSFHRSPLMMASGLK